MEQKFKQWTLTTTEDAYKLFNPSEEIAEQFYSVVPGPYGNPIIIVEPTLAFPVPEGLTYVNSKGEVVVPAEKVGGIICIERNGTAKYRFSLSSTKAPKFETTSDGVIIDGEHWYLTVLFSKDKNRIINYDVFYSRTKPEEVRVLELQDLNFNLF